MRLIMAVLMSASFALSGATVAQDIPYRGSVTSVEQNSSLTFECSGSNLTIQCDFIQLLVTQEAATTAEAMNDAVQESLVQGATSSLCVDLVNQIKEASTAPNALQMGDRERADAARLLNLIGRFCAEPNEATAREMMAYSEERKAKSCKVAALPFELKLNWNSQSARWESVSAPDGGCGIVTMIFMEKDKAYPIFWNYREDTIVTDKTGTDIIRGDCSAWPEEEQRYRWQPDTLRRSCEYISFGF